MTSIKITNKDGIYETFTLSYNVVTGEEAITDLRGFSQNYSVNFAVEQGARQQGGTTVGVTGQRRTVTFNIHLFKSSREKLLERAGDIVNYLNPHYGKVTITHTNDYRSREIEGYLRKFDLKDETQIGGYGILMLTFECDEPFFKDIEDTLNTLGTGENVFQIFELSAISNPTYWALKASPSDGDFFFGETFTAGTDHPLYGNTVTQFGLNTIEANVNNTGNYLVPVHIVIQGPVDDPQLTRVSRVNGLTVTDTLKFVINGTTVDTIGSNDFAIVNTTQGLEEATLYSYQTFVTLIGLTNAQKHKADNDNATTYVEINDNGDSTYTNKIYTKININKYLDPDSVYWKLNMGENTITLVSNGGTPIYSITYRQRYISA